MFSFENNVIEFVRFDHNPTPFGFSLRAATVLCVLFSALAAVRSVDGATYVVDRITDTGSPQACTAAPNDCDFRGAIAAANQTTAADTIAFDPVVFSTPQAVDVNWGQITVVFGSIVTINGNGLITISAVNGKRGLNVDSGGIATLNGVTITGGWADVTGGGIMNLGTVTLNDSTVTGSTARRGGGIYNAGTLNVTNSAITFNASVIDGDEGGGGIYGAAGSVTHITGSTISDNTADLTAAGIYNAGTMDLTNSIVSRNVTLNTTIAISSAGGIFNTGGLTSLNSTISDNATTGGLSGGAILMMGGTVSLINSTMSGNTSNSIGGSQRGGGGVMVRTGTLNITNSTVSGNSAFGGNGGGVNSESGTVNLTNATVTGNTGTGNSAAGGIFGFPVNVRNSIISGNTGVMVNDAYSVTSQGHNLIGNATFLDGDTNGNILNQNPRLAPLGNYGGPTQTHALLSNSPALDAGDDCVLTAVGCGPATLALSIDQRGGAASRKTGLHVDIGAFERNITFNQASVPNGTRNVFYTQTLSASRVVSLAARAGSGRSATDNFAPFTFSIVPVAGQQVPPGLSLDPNGTISGTPTTPGMYTFTIKAVDGADQMAGVSQYAIQVFAPTAASVSVSGRVTTPDGRGLRNAVVTMANSGGVPRTTITSSFGYYRLDGVTVGETYIISVQSKRFRFTSRFLSVQDELNEVDFVADPEVDGALVPRFGF